MQGPAAEAQLDLSQGTSLNTMRMMKLAYGPGLDLFERPLQVASCAS